MASSSTHRGILARLITSVVIHPGSEGTAWPNLAGPRGRRGEGGGKEGERKVGERETTRDRHLGREREGGGGEGGGEGESRRNTHTHTHGGGGGGGGGV